MSATTSSSRTSNTCFRQKSYSLPYRRKHANRKPCQPETDGATTGDGYSANDEDSASEETFSRNLPIKNLGGHKRYNADAVYTGASGLASMRSSMAGLTTHDLIEQVPESQYSNNQLVSKQLRINADDIPTPDVGMGTKDDVVPDSETSGAVHISKAYKRQLSKVAPLPRRIEHSQLPAENATTSECGSFFLDSQPDQQIRVVSQAAYKEGEKCFHAEMQKLEKSCFQDIFTTKELKERIDKSMLDAEKVFNDFSSMTVTSPYYQYYKNMLNGLALIAKNFLQEKFVNKLERDSEELRLAKARIIEYEDTIKRLNKGRPKSRPTFLDIVSLGEGVMI